MGVAATCGIVKLQDEYKRKTVANTMFYSSTKAPYSTEEMQYSCIQQKKRIVITNWKDLKDVLMASCLWHITNEIGECLRSLVEGGKFRRIIIPRPKIIEEYSGKMYYMDKG